MIQLNGILNRHAYQDEILLKKVKDAFKNLDQLKLTYSPWMGNVNLINGKKVMESTWPPIK
jgi:uncharacterized membrane protein YjjP (DUF1212 family)